MDDNRNLYENWGNEEGKDQMPKMPERKLTRLSWKGKQKVSGDKVPGNKKGKTKVIVAVVLVAAIAAGSVFAFRSRGKKAQASGNGVMESKVQKGNLSQTVEGTGTLSNASSTDLKIPVGLKIKKIKVSEGDEVKKGDTLATVDKTSLLAALAQTQEDLDDVNNQIGDEADSDTSKYVESSVDGRVKKIYASKNTDAADTVLEKGALMLISLDGKMAVKMDTSVDLTVGQEVKVVLSSGSSVTGTVIKADDDSCTITVTDNGTKYNDKVTAYTSSGTKIGTGRLYINKEAKVTATSGTVSSILVSENESVSEGDNLIKLKGDFQSEEYLSLESEKEDLEEKLEALLKIAKNNTITADTAGIITEINITEDAESGSTSGSSSSNSSSTSGSSSSSNSSVNSGSSSSSVSASGTSSSGSGNVATATGMSAEKTSNTIKAVSLSTNKNTASSKASVQAAAEYTTNGKVVPTAVQTASVDNTAQMNSETTQKQNEAGTTTAAKNETTGSDSSTSGSSSGSQSGNSAAENNTTDSTNNGGSSTTNNKTDTTANSSTTNSNQSGNSTTKNSESNNSTSGTGSTATQNTTENKNASNGMGANSTGKSSAGGMNGSYGAVAGGSMSSGGTFSGTTSDSTSASSSASTSSSTSTNTELTSAFGIASGDEMTLSVNVDEMDILSIETGQKATVTFDAIENKEYEGKITSIDKNGTTSNGTTKYPVEITLTKEDSMMSGMNASVTITTSEVSDALLVPAAAVTEEGNTSYVYTKKDSKTEELSGKTEVETGDTDGTNIVITSGLSEGDTVYYSMTTGASSDDSSKDTDSQDKQNMKMNGNFGGGHDGNSDGGTPPSGGGPGGSN